MTYVLHNMVMVHHGATSGIRPDVWISYAGPDRPWAEWVAAQLEAAGVMVELDVWDWLVGENAQLQMNEALQSADRVVALWSPAYFEPQRFTQDEWTAVMAARPAVRGSLIPIRVADVTPPPLLRPLIYRDVFGLDEADARRELLAAVQQTSRRDSSPAFPGNQIPSPGVGGPRVPGSLPEVWNVPGRTLEFTGRQTLLAMLRERLVGGNTTLVAAMNGMGGVGKTSLAIEYSHLFAGEYEKVWWVDSERPELIGDNLCRIGVAARWVGEGTPVAAAWAEVSARLRQADRWLVVLDNVAEPDHIRPWLPQGPGHTIITSRHRGFGHLARPIDVEVFTRAESIDLVRAHLPRVSVDEAGALAEAVEDLPLALSQCMGFLEQTEMPVLDYLEELSTHTRETLSEGWIGSYPQSLLVTIEATLARLRPDDAVAIELLHLAAVLSPEPIMLDWLGAAPPEKLPDGLAYAVTRPLVMWRSLGRLRNLGLAKVSAKTLQLHRLTLAVLRDQRSSGELEGDRLVATLVVSAAEPKTRATDPKSWPVWARLLPHILELDPSTAPSQIRKVACGALYYLFMRGEYDSALDLGYRWHARWQRDSDPDDEYVLLVRHYLACVHMHRKDHQIGYDLETETLERYQRWMGVNHPDTLRSAIVAAYILGQLGRYQESYDLHLDTLGRLREVLGPTHHDTLGAEENLAVTLRDWGHDAEAYELGKQTYELARRVLGASHPRTLANAIGVAGDLRGLGRFADAYDLDQEILGLHREVYGPNHPLSLDAANNLAIDLRALGRYREAQEADSVTYESRKSMFGPHHPDTLQSARNLAIDLRALADELERILEAPTAE